VAALLVLWELVVTLCILYNWLFLRGFRFIFAILSRTVETWKLEEEFEDTKGVIRICISKKNRQHNEEILLLESCEKCQVLAWKQICIRLMTNFNCRTKCNSPLYYYINAIQTNTMVILSGYLYFIFRYTFVAVLHVNYNPEVKKIGEIIRLTTPYNVKL